jgi:hypothetical protein
VVQGIDVAGQRPTMVGCEQLTTTANIVLFWNSATSGAISDAYTNEAGGGATVGMGFRYVCASTFTVDLLIFAACIGAMNRGANHSVLMGPSGNFGSRSYLGGQWTVKGAGGVGMVSDPPGTLAGQAVFGDSNTNNAQPRLTGHTSSTTPFTVLQNPVNLWRLNFENFGLAIHGCIYLKDIFGGAMNIDGCTGDGTGPYGLDCSQSSGLQLTLGTQIANTVAGTVAEVRVAADAHQKWADFTKTNLIDAAWNRIQGAAGFLCSSFMFAICSDVDGLALGEPVKLDTGAADHVASANDASAANATAVGVCVTAAVLNEGVYVALDGIPYVLSTGGTVSQGGVAFAATGTGGIGIASSTAIASGHFQQRLGRWLDSTHLVWNPEIVPTAVP